MNVDMLTQRLDGDLIVVGGGHAGIEAALAASRLGLRTLLVTQSAGEIGRMPCNPAVGGLGKAQLVREIDVLGGEMALATDETGIQFRILNRRKGPAVRAARAQVDKRAYQTRMARVVQAQPRLAVAEGEVVGLLVESARNARRVAGVLLADGREAQAPRVVISTGTFLRGLMHTGEAQRVGGREGADSAEGLSGALAALGLELRRLKTGTPMRLHRETIDWDLLEPQPGDPEPRPFSHRTREFAPEQMLCHLAWTTERTHALIRANLHRSPLYAGVIEGRGPRYCPSVEDKVVRFPDKDRHQVFLEPEGRDSDEIYVNGLSTSLPADVQVAIVRSIPGLERAELVRFGYAVEYDSLPSWQVRTTLESKNIDGLYFAGQILGTSGYEEAAAQGFLAGVNAAMAAFNQPSLILRRDEAYMGVLVDDLVTKEISEPYRMFTSRAEHRLTLRCDNALRRLLPHARRLGLLARDELARLEASLREEERLAGWLAVTPVRDPVSCARTPAAEIVRRPDGGLAAALALAAEQGNEYKLNDNNTLDVLNLLETVESDIRYAGYVARQERMLGRLAHLDDLVLPPDLEYHRLSALSFEAREKLSRMRPANLGQAARIDGVRQADLAILAILVGKVRA